MAIDTRAQAAACGVHFRDLKPPLSEPCLALLDAQGFLTTTPVQAATIPLFCTNKDVVVEAVTGSGKTLAFVLPLVEIIRRLETPLKRHQVGAIIISPTRELAAQISVVAAPFIGSVPGLRAALLVGGTSVSADISALATEGANVLIGTPGRLDDVLERATCLDLRQLEVLVLDEADRLLEMGFQCQLTSIMGRLSKQRRTGLFSATQTRAVAELAAAGMRNPVRVEVQVSTTPSLPLQADVGGGLKPNAESTKALAEGDTTPGTVTKPGKTPAGLHLQYVVCEAEEKASQLAHFLAQHADRKTIVYVMTCACVDYWTVALGQLAALKKVPMRALHGKMKQSVREGALAEFVALPAGILLCTDVAARGLDIPGVDCIVQYDPPQDPKAFVHRAGRTARMGRSGNALVYLLPKEDAYVEFLRLQGVPLAELAKARNAPDITPLLRAAAKADRDVMERGLRAYVSFFRGYKEHHCNYIFRWKELQLGKIGMSFGLLQLPAMPEFRRWPALAKGFTPAAGVNLDTIKYRDKGREKQRQKNLAVKFLETQRDAKTKQGSKRNENAKEAKSAAKATAAGKRTHQQTNALDDDDDEMDMEEYRLLKKVKKGVISEAEYAVAMGLPADMGTETEICSVSPVDTEIASTAENAATVDATEGDQARQDGATCQEPEIKVKKMVVNGKLKLKRKAAYVKSKSPKGPRLLSNRKQPGDMSNLKWSKPGQRERRKEQNRRALGN